MLQCRLLFALTGAALAGPAWGQAVPSREPSSTHIFPAGGQRGTVVKVRVGGECLPPGMEFKLVGPGVTAPAVLGPEAKARYEPAVRRPPRDADGLAVYSREWTSEVKIAADTAPGARFWRATGAFGGTQARPFLVGDLPEFIETEPNSRPELAERIALPVVVNGQIAGERDQDFYVFSAKAGAVVVCDVMAARIGSPLDPVVTITNSVGGRVEVQEVRVGGDPVLAFRAPSTGDYRLHVANLGFPGGPAFVYRITLATASYAPFAFPAGGRTSETGMVDLYTLTGTRTLGVVREKVLFPATPGPFRLRGVTPLVAGDWPEVTSRGTDLRTGGMELVAPLTVNGHFLTSDAEDWYRFAAKKGELFTITCQSFPRDSASVPVLALQDSTGAPLFNATAVESPADGIDFDWTSPADGTYRLRLRDLQHGTRGGPEFIYRLSLRSARPDFSLCMEPNFVNVVPGGKTEIDLIVRRSGGFAGPIDLTASGLPEGVKFEPATIPSGVPRIKLAFSAKDDTRPIDVPMSVGGRATIGGKAIARRAIVSTFGWEATNLALTVQHKPLFKISCNEAYQYAHRGTVYPYALTVERLNGFTGAITLQLCERQVQDLDGIEVVQSVVPAGEKESKALVYLPESMHASVQHHSRPYVQGYASFTDKWGQAQTILAVCDKRCMIRTLPPVVKLRAAVKELEAQPGRVVTCRLLLDRTANFTGAAEVELVATPDFEADKIRFGAGETEAVVKIRVGPDIRSRDDRSVTFRATGKLPSGATAVTEATVPVRVK